MRRLAGEVVVLEPLEQRHAADLYDSLARPRRVALAAAPPARPRGVGGTRGRGGRGAGRRPRGAVRHRRPRLGPGHRQHALPGPAARAPRAGDRLDLARPRALGRRRQRRVQAAAARARLRPARLHPGRVQDRRPQRALARGAGHAAGAVRGDLPPPHGRARRPARLGLVQRDRRRLAAGAGQPPAPLGAQAVRARRPGGTGRGGPRCPRTRRTPRPARGRRAWRGRTACSRRSRRRSTPARRRR